MNMRKLLLPLALIGILVFGALFFLNGQSRQPKAPVEEPTTAVVVAKALIPQDAEITVDSLETKQIKNSERDQLVPADAILDSEALIGGRARVAIAPGDYFTPANTTPLPAQFSGMIAPGFVAVTFHAPPEPSLYDLRFLNPDDRVDVFGVYLDQGTGETISVRLASNVKLLAVDKVKSQAEEEARKKKLEAKVAELEAQLQARQAQTTPPPSQEELDGMRKTIEDTRSQINPEVPEELRSLTVEVTPAQSQKIALWRQSADITVALHRQGDAEEAIWGGALASVEGQPVGAPGGAPVVMASQGAVLTLDDVVPLDRRDPAKYYQEQQQAEQHRTMIAERRLNQLEVRANELQTEAEIRNLLKYGTRQPTDLPPPSLGGGGLVPVTVAPGGLTKDDLNQALGGLNRRMGSLEKKLESRTTAAAQPQPLRGTVEVYRGTQMTVEHY